MPEITRTRWKIVGHHIESENRIRHFSVPEASGLNAATAPAGAGGQPEIVTGQRKGIYPDDTIIEFVQKYTVVSVGTPPASEVVAESPEPIG